VADSNYIINKLTSYGVSQDDATILAAVAYSESSYRPEIIGDESYGGSVGLFQINLPAHANKLKQWTKSSNRKDWIEWLYNINNNIYAASQVYFSQGLGAWTMYRNGHYKKYLGKNLSISLSSGSINQVVTVNNLEQFIAFARAQVGKPYVWGNEGPDSFDCSGLVQYVWLHFKVQISRTTYTQFPECQEISASNLQTGDLLFSNFDENGPGHVGIYIGNDRVVQAKGVAYGVIECSVGEFGVATYARHSPIHNTLGDSVSGFLADSNDFSGPFGVIKIPESNFEVVPDSISSGDVLYGRRYRVIVSSLNGEIAFDVSQLRCTFSCIKNIMEANYSEVVIYNLSPTTENIVIKEGYRVVVEAGYEGSQYGIIFDGNVIQPLRDKEGGVTFKLSLVSMDSDMFLVSGTVNFSIMRGQNSRSLAESIVNSSNVSTQLGEISQNFSESKLTRGKAIFGLTSDYLRQIAQSQAATFYMEDGKVNIIRADDYPEGEIIELSPESGLIGVPAQSDYGATIKMLLNPRVKLGSMIHIDNSLIHNKQFQQGQAFYGLDQDGIYRVIKITHKGDTRGEDWYTEVETVTQSGLDVPNMLSGSRFSNPN